MTFYYLIISLIELMSILTSKLFALNIIAAMRVDLWTGFHLLGGDLAFIDQGYGMIHFLKGILKSCQKRVHFSENGFAWFI